LEEVESILNDFHNGAYVGHLLGLAKTKIILRVDYFSPLIFKDCIEAVKICHPCQVYTQKMSAHPTLLFPFIMSILSQSGALILLPVIYLQQEITSTLLWP